MEKEMTPSPLPWKIEDGPNGVIPIFSKGKPVVCIVRYSDNPNLSKAEGMANARLIETAVNSHAALVDALKEIAGGECCGNFVGGCEQNHYGGDTKNHCAISKAKAALRLAGEAI